jgi:hypothetical protein
MERSPDPMECWHRWVGRDLVAIPPALETGRTCRSCGSTGRPCVRAGAKVGGEVPCVCVCCLSIRVQYPAANGVQARLGAGSFALASPSGSVIWSSSRLPASPLYTVEPITGRFGDVLRSFILSPPEPPFLFVAFARRNEGRSYHLNTTQDLIWVSGGGLKITGRPIERFDRVAVADFVSRFGDLRREVFRSLAYASLARYRGEAEAFRRLVAREPRSRAILAAMPVPGSPEYTLIASLLP